MKKDEMKNRISMALKDPILQQGFEIICKESAELKEANAQWEQRNVTLKDALEYARKIYGDELEKAYKENAELRKELKKWKDEWQEQVQKAIDEGYARTLQTIQLTKARKLLKRWVELYKPKLEGYPITPIQEQTEQFLKEMGKCQSQKQH